MTKVPIVPPELRLELQDRRFDLQELRRRIYRKAKSEKTHRFWGLFVRRATVFDGLVFTIGDGRAA